MRLKRFFAAVLTLSLLLPGALPQAGAAAREDLRGVWVASVYNIDYPSKPGLTVDQLKSEADAILNNAADWGLNAVFLQVRPSADALYPSALFPWSCYLTGTAGQAPADGFDPLAYWVEGAHARGLELHAWLNPYRITKAGESELAALPASSPAKLHPEWVIEYEDNYYFDPGLPAVQRLVVDGAAEIAQNYDVDGIHLDDYFYPGTDFADSATYARYGTDFESISDWRRDNVNTLVAQLDETLHALDPDLSFGISPAGIWDNKSTNPRGSATAGRSSYSAIYCDTLAWIEAGTVDYICPQIYWSIGYEIADFSILVDWWENAVSRSDVALYIGMGAYRMEDTKPGDTWYGTAELSRQLTMIHDGRDVQGEIYYNYGALRDCAGAADLLRTTYAAEAPAPTPSTPMDEQAAHGLAVTFIRFITALFQF